MSERGLPFARVVGVAFAAIGLAHFVNPAAFDALTRSAFPTNTQQHVYADGVIETALGVGLIVPRTRRLAVAGLLAYSAYLAANVARNR